MTLGALQRRYGVLLVMRWLPVGLVSPVLVLIFLRRDLTLSQVGPVIAAYSLVTLLAEIPTGGMADAYGRRRVLVLSSLLHVGFFAMLLAFDGVALMALAGAVGGASRALDSGPLEAWFVDSCRRVDPAVDIERRLARGNAVDGVTLAAGAIVGGFIGSAGGGELDAVLVAAMVAQMVHALAAATLMTDIAADPGQGANEAARRAGARAVFREARSVVAAAPSLQWMLAAGIGVGIALTSVETLWQPRFDELIDGDAAPTVLGFVLAASFAASAIGSESGPRLRTWLGWSPRRFLVSVGVAQGGAFVVMALANSAWLTAVGMLAMYGLLGLAHPVFSNVLHAHSPDSARTTMVSARSLTMQFGGLLGNLTLPALAASTSIPVAWTVAAVAIAAAGLAYSGVREKVPLSV